MAYILFTCSLTPSPPEVHVQRGYIRNTVWGDGDDAFAKPLFVWPCRHVQWLAAAREPNNQSWIIPRFCNIKGAWRIDMGFTGLPFLIHHFSTWCSLHSLHIFKREFYFLSFPALVLIQLWRFMIFLQRNLKFLCFFRNKNSGFFPGNLTPGPGLRQSSQVESFRRLKFLVFDAKSLDGTENPAAALRTVDLTSFLGI